MALSHSSVALPTKAALICSEPAAALRLGRELVSHGLGGAKRIGTDLPALGGASDAASPTTSTEEPKPDSEQHILRARVSKLGNLDPPHPAAV